MTDITSILDDIDDFIENEVNREIELDAEEALKKEMMEQEGIGGVSTYTPSKHTEEELDEIAPDIF